MCEGAIMMAKKQKMEHRKIPLKEDFMKTKTISARIYGHLQSISYLSEGKQRYVLALDATPSRIQSGLQQKVGNVEPLSISLGTIKNGLALFKKSGLITSGELIINGSKKKCFFLPEEKSHFQLIELDTLRYLVNTSNSEVIKTYAYLLNKNQHFKSYSFTTKEIAGALGYSTNNNNTYKMFNDIFTCLENNGLLKKEHYYEQTGQNGKIKVPRMRIISMSLKVKGM